MKMFMLVISLIPILWGIFVTSYHGLDLRKWSDWRYGGLTFLCGVISTIALDGNLVDGLIVGAILAFFTLFNGVMARRHRREYERDTKSLMKEYSESNTFFGRLVKRISALLRKD